MILHGRNINIKLNGTIIACAKSCKLNVTCDLTEIASPTSGTWKQWLAGRKEWDMDLTKFVSVIRYGYNLVGQTVTVEIGQVLSSDRTELTSDKLTGTAIVTAYALSGEVKGLSTAQFQLKGSGSLS